MKGFPRAGLQFPLTCFTVLAASALQRKATPLQELHDGRTEIVSLTSAGNLKQAVALHVGQVPTAGALKEAAAALQGPAGRQLRSLQIQGRQETEYKSMGWASCCS